MLRANGDLVTAIGGGEGDGGRLAQRRRRARILSTARRLVALHGREGFVLKEVAELCGVSVQTIYNLVGDRSRVMAAALNEFIAAAFVDVGPETGQPTRFLALAENYWTTAVGYPAYVRNATLDYFSNHLVYRQTVRTTSARLFADRLCALKRSGALSPSADTQALASRFTSIAAGMTYEWAVGCRSLAELRADLIESHAALIRDTLSPPARHQMELWIGSHADAPACTAAA